MSFTNIEDEYALSDVKLVIPVVFHVIERSDNVGRLDLERLDSQIDVLNEDFSAKPGTPGDGGPLSQNMHIQFVLAGVNRVENDAWFDFPVANEDTYKQALHWYPDEYLNVYTVGLPEDGSLGWATFPQESAGDFDDGIVLLYDTVGRNGPNPPYNQGRTLTHEVGHYLGLLHTFSPNDEPGISGVCENGWDQGDLIQDTPSEDAEIYGCPNEDTACGAASTIDCWQYSQLYELY